MAGLAAYAVLPYRVPKTPVSPRVPRHLKEAIALLDRWASGSTPVSLFTYGDFFVAGIHGLLHSSSAYGTFGFLPLDNRFRASFRLPECRSISVHSEGGRVFVSLEGRRGRLFITESDPQADAWSLLQLSGGRPRYHQTVHGPASGRVPA